MHLTTKDIPKFYKNNKGENVFSIKLSEDRNFKSPVDVKLTYEHPLDLAKLLTSLFPFGSQN